MGRLIDADALMEKYNLKDATKYGNRDAEQQAHSYSTLMMYEVADMIEDAPTIEAVPVVKAEWFLLDECANEGVYCSKCLKKVYRTEYANQKVKSKFCPNCGAKMEGSL